jgi:acetyl esterase/lipase
MEKSAPALRRFDGEYFVIWQSFLEYRRIDIRRGRIFAFPRRSVRIVFVPMKDPHFYSHSIKFSVWLTALILSVAVTLGAEPVAEPQPQLLWPNGTPDHNGLQGPEVVKSCVGNISIPTITVYHAPKEKATGAAVVVIPGGGYGVVCVTIEGMPIAKKLNERGITAITLKYRLPNKNHLIPANDARQAIRTVRANAEAWGIDPKRIGVSGFSAGGHLASTVATVFDAGNPTSDDPIARVSSRPDFAMLLYPVISMNEEIAHKGSRNNLMGSENLIERYSSELHVTEKTPPCFLLHCSDDSVVKVENSLRFYQALIANKVPATCLIFEEGEHGPGAFKMNPSWESSLDAWLKKRGCMK